MKSLRSQINTRILLLAGVIFLIGSAVTLWQAKRAVEDEMQSSIHLAVQLISFNLSQNNVQTDWLIQLNDLKETRHLQIQLKEPSGNLLAISQKNIQNADNTPPEWFVNLVKSAPIQVERTLITNKGEALILIIQANPLNEIREIWQESLSFFSLLLLLICLILMVVQMLFHQLFKTIAVIVKGLERVELGDYQQPLPAFSNEEMNRIGEAINHLIKKLKASQAENHALTQHNLEIQEQERQKLAQELHDELGQSLTAIKVMNVAMTRAELQNALIKQSSDAVIEICNHLMGVVRSMMQQLHPLVLTELGLRAALEDLILHWQKRSSPLKITFDCEAHIETLPENIHIHIFRIMQEALTNIIRHANAKNVSISLTVHQNVFTLKISDDGQGCEMLTIKKGFGLLSMRERIRSLEGELLIQTAPQEGMNIEVKIPL